MSDVSIDSSVIAKLIQKCATAKNELAGAAKKCKAQASQVGTQWNDEKSKEFLTIVHECGESLKKPIDELDRCDAYLKEIQSIVAEYERISFDGGSFGDNASLSSFLSSLRAGNAANNSASRAASSHPRDLSHTQYGFEPMMVNGEMCMMYNKPYETANSLVQHQGNNSRDVQGDCGLCQCVNTLRLAGISDVSEDDIINVATTCSGETSRLLDMHNPDPEERGGTTAGGRQEVLQRYNLDSYIQPISTDRNEAVSRLSQAVSSGRGVIVSVDAGRLWNDSRYSGGGHAISLLSVSENGDRFIYSDTGAGTVGVISASDLGSALTGRPANITSNIIR